MRCTKQTTVYLTQRTNTDARLPPILFDFCASFFSFTVEFHSIFLSILIFYILLGLLLFAQVKLFAYNTYLDCALSHNILPLYKTHNLHTCSQFISDIVIIFVCRTTQKKTNRQVNTFRLANIFHVAKPLRRHGIMHYCYYSSYLLFGITLSIQTTITFLLAFDRFCCLCSILHDFVHTAEYNTKQTFGLADSISHTYARTKISVYLNVSTRQYDTLIAFQQKNMKRKASKKICHCERNFHLLIFYFRLL